MLFNTLMRGKSVFFSDLCCLIIIAYFSFTESAEDGNNTSDDDKSIFESNLIVPALLPSVPKEICSVLYEPGLIIVPGQFYFPYQIQGLPEISWNYKDDKFYSIIVLGAFNKNPHPQNSTDDLHKERVIPPENSWLQWVIVNVRKNNLNSGTVLQPFVNTSNFEPNGTHKIVQTFAVFEQFEKCDLKLDDENYSAQTLLERHFAPLSNFINSFGENFLLAGDFFYITLKPNGVFRDSSPVRYLNWRRNELMNLVKPHDYAFHGTARE
ncbi:putative odorant-binding protein A5 [Planococcus citri]|uniref:putative odorant-binding protein A5 n=1 Tax=Planococcus citri TaxID=170843 RepID=UPI0031F7DA49